MRLARAFMVSTALTVLAATPALAADKSVNPKEVEKLMQQMEEQQQQLEAQEKKLMEQQRALEIQKNKFKNLQDNFKAVTGKTNIKQIF